MTSPTRGLPQIINSLVSKRTLTIDIPYLTCQGQIWLSIISLTDKELETHGCVCNAVSTDALVSLKYHELELELELELIYFT